MQSKIKTNYLSIILLLFALMLTAAITVSVTLALVYDARKGTTTITFASRLILVVSNLQAPPSPLSGDPLTLKVSGQSADGKFYPNTTIYIEPPTIRLASNSSSAYVRYTYSFTYYKNNIATPGLASLFVEGAVSTISFSAAGTPWAQEGITTTYKYVNVATLNVMEKTTPAVNAWNPTGFKIGVPAALTAAQLEGVRIRVDLKIEAVQSSGYSESAAWGAAIFSSWIPLTY